MSLAVSSEKKPKTPKENRFFQDFVKITGAIPALIWMRPKILYSGDRQVCCCKGGVVIAPNHVSFFDPIMVFCTFWQRRLNFMVSKEVYKSKPFAWMLTKAGCIEVDKTNFNLRSMHAVVDRLKAGKAIVIYPEGEVNSEAQTKSYKSGAVLMAQLAAVPIQPVYIAPLDKWYHRRVAVVGEPIDLSSMCSRFPTVEEMEKLSQYIHSKEEELAQYYQNSRKRGK